MSVGLLALLKQSDDYGKRLDNVFYQEAVNRGLTLLFYGDVHCFSLKKKNDKH